MGGLDLLQKSLSANNLTDCLALCVDRQPSCIGVAFDPEEAQGPDNCYLKEDLGGRGEKENFEVAILQSFLEEHDDCDSLGSKYVARDVEYEIRCGDDIEVNDLEAASTTETMADCLAQCSREDDCAGVVYQADRAFDTFNCHLKVAWVGDKYKDTSSRGSGVFHAARRLEDAPSTTGISSSIESSSTAAPSTTSGSAQTTETSDGNQAADNESSSSGSNTGAIAGGVVGGVVALALIGLAIFFWRRRRNARQNAGAPNELQGHPMQTDYKPTPQTEYQQPYQQQAYQQPYQQEPAELEWDRRTPSELPAQSYR
jgi:hypothetical protein